MAAESHASRIPSGRDGPVPSPVTARANVDVKV
jgi:hypothetical protein